MEKKTLITCLILLSSCGLDTQTFQYFKCTQDRYATYYSLAGSGSEGNCFAGQCAPTGLYSFQMDFSKSTCGSTDSFTFTDHIATGNHPLRFLLLCGYNRVVIDDTWGIEGKLGEINYQIFEGEAVEGKKIEGMYIRERDGCKNTYNMTVQLEEEIY